MGETFGDVFSEQSVHFLCKTPLIVAETVEHLKGSHFRWGDKMGVLNLPLQEQKHPVRLILKPFSIVQLRRGRPQV